MQRNATQQYITRIADSTYSERSQPQSAYSGDWSSVSAAMATTRSELLLLLLLLLCCCSCSITTQRLPSWTSAAIGVWYSVVGRWGGVYGRVCVRVGECVSEKGTKKFRMLHAVLHTCTGVRTCEVLLQRIHRIPLLVAQRVHER